jgi:hypothetical protein
MTKKTNESALFQAIQNSANIERCNGEKLLPFLTRSYESAAGLTPTIPAPSAAAIRGAVQARLNAAKAKGLARSAVTLARQAVKAIVPASPQLGQPGFIAAKIAKAAAKPALADAHDAALIEAATHRSAPESERPAALAELNRRGISISPSGIVSKNLKTSQQ